MILSICLNPTLQKTFVLDDLQENEVNRCSEYYVDASGKGLNVTRILKQLGKPCTHLTHMPVNGQGRDELLSLCAADNLELIYADTRAPLRSCYTIISKRNLSTTEVIEEAKSVEDGVEQKIIDLFEQLLPKTEMLIISGSKAAGYSSSLFPYFVKRANEEGVFVILDYRGEDLQNSLKYHPDIIKPNVSEFVSTFFPGQRTGEQSTPAALRESVKTKMVGLTKLYESRFVLTAGSNPGLFSCSSGIQDFSIDLADKPLNTIGCGDAFTAGMASVIYDRCILYGNPLDDEILQAANAEGARCGRLNAEQLRPGTIECC